MTVETATTINQLDTTLPLAADLISEGDDHIRLLKTVLKTTFPNVAGAVTPSHVEFNFLAGLTSGVQTQLNAKANRTGDTYTGTHNFTGATVQLPGTTAIGAVTATEIGYLSGVTSAIQTQFGARSLKAGDTYSGAHNYTGATITVPTQSPGDNTQNAASTAFVVATAFNSALPGQSGNAGRFVRTNGTSASWSELVDQPIAISINTAAVVCRTYVLTASLTLTLPASPANGDWVEVINRSGTATPVVARNGNNIQGLAEDMTINQLNASIRLVFVTGQGWVIK